MIEIIVTLIIIGVLAMIWLSSVFSWIEQSKGVEGNLNLELIVKNVEACVATGKTLTACFLNLCPTAVTGDGGLSYSGTLVSFNKTPNFSYFFMAGPLYGLSDSGHVLSATKIPFKITP